MPDISPTRGSDAAGTARPRFIERRAHPRHAIQALAAPCPEAVHDDRRRGPGLVERLRVALGLRRSQPRNATPDVAQPASRSLRLQSISFQLEAILEELDELGLQRTAIDVCMALERVKAQLAEREVAVGADEGSGMSFARDGRPEYV